MKLIHNVSLNIVYGVSNCSYFYIMTVFNLTSFVDATRVSFISAGTVLGTSLRRRSV